ncbi:hypothetical protein ACU4GG_22190 [Streptomyces nojiriensis]
MTVLITGARGKVGRAVLDRLHAAGLAVRAASADPAGPTVPDGVEVVPLALDRPGPPRSTKPRSAVSARSSSTRSPPASTSWSRPPRPPAWSTSSCSPRPP